jgi:hypothetical protein
VELYPHSPIHGEVLEHKDNLTCYLSFFNDTAQKEAALNYPLAMTSLNSTPLQKKGASVSYLAQQPPLKVEMTSRNVGQMSWISDKKPSCDIEVLHGTSNASPYGDYSSMSRVIMMTKSV